MRKKKTTTAASRCVEGPLGLHQSIVVVVVVVVSEAADCFDSKLLISYLARGKWFWLFPVHLVAGLDS